MAKINDVEYGEWKAADVRVKVNTSLVLDLPTSLKFDYLVSNLKMKDIHKEHRHTLAHISKRELSRYFVKVGIEKLFEELFQGKLNPPEEDSQQSTSASTRSKIQELPTLHPETCMSVWDGFQLVGRLDTLLTGHLSKETTELIQQFNSYAKRVDIPVIMQEEITTPWQAQVDFRPELTM